MAVLSDNKSPSVSVIIPTYNSGSVIKQCLDSIKSQDYPRELLEIVIADAGSDDETLEILSGFASDNPEIKINKIDNPLKTGEAGKAAALRKAGNEIIALIDSDNILDDKQWMNKMVEPFREPDIIGSEPLRYDHRYQDSLITRYCALIGANDPMCVYLGNHDRFSHLSGNWTGMQVSQRDRGNYLDIELDPVSIPTIGANGFMVRRDELDALDIGDYFFDIDVVAELTRKGRNRFAKVKTGIVHIFAGSTATFYRKQKRRIRDYYYYKSEDRRTYPWNKASKVKVVVFALRSIVVIPTVLDAYRGYRKVKDRAWFFHPVACIITVFVYSTGTIRGMMNPSPHKRKNWRQ